MPPKKEKLSKQQVRDLLKDYRICFEGPAPRREWPDKHEHHFQAIRKISTILYDEYKVNRSISSKQRTRYKDRANQLREKAINLLDDLSINEATWRGSLENVISKPFEKEIVCRRCGYETWHVDIQASPLNDDTEIIVRDKRENRRPCMCPSKAIGKPPVNNDDEDGPIFASAIQTTVTHCIDDNLQHLSIPMEPDRVIGLRPTRRINHYVSSSSRDLDHYPIQGRNILYPFLVIEAKKEADAPGFRAIQKQTAFPVRRLLKTQEALRSACGIEGEPFLVWFFAYQGEEWRLYAGTLDGEKVRIFDLWHGTIESQDGALQLLLIVDYIWSWARDLYRPTIANFLAILCPNNRDYSPASTDRYRYSISVHTESSSDPPGHRLHSTSMDQALTNLDSVDKGGQTMEHTILDAEVPSCLPTTAVRDADTHPLFRWPVSNPNSTIHHSNIAFYTFQLFTLSPAAYQQVIPTEENNYLLFLSKQQLLDLGNFWTNSRLHSLPISDALFPCILLFRMYYGQNTWEINKALNVIVLDGPSLSAYPLAPTNSLQEGFTANEFQRFESQHLFQSVSEIQRIQGRESVTYAFRDVTFFLTYPEANTGRTSPTCTLRWELFEYLRIGINGPTIAKESLNYEDLARLSSYPSVRLQKLLEVIPHPNDPPPPLLPDLQPTIGEGNAVILMRSHSCPSTCPKFCLYILGQEDYNRPQPLHQVLRQTLKDRNIYVDQENCCDLTEEDKCFLQNWYKALKDAR